MKHSGQEKTSVLVIDLQTGRPIVDEMSNEQKHEVTRNLNADETRKIKLNGRECRMTSVSNDSTRVYGISFDPDNINSSKSFSSYLKFFLLSSEKFNGHLQRIEDRESSKFKRLIHNLRSLNAKIMQEVYYIALQDKLIGSTAKTLEYIQGEVEADTKSAAKAFLEILKCSAAQRAEFSAFEKMNGNVTAIDKGIHHVHQVVMNVFYLFFSEFTDKKVRCTVDKTELQAFFDYESMQVCLYHIVENSAKYTKPGTALNVYFHKNSGTIDVSFEMISTYIHSDERSMICQEGYSGKEAKKKNLHGDGFGLNISSTMAKLNSGSLHIIAGEREFPNSDFARNKFILTLPLSGK